MAKARTARPAFSAASSLAFLRQMRIRLALALLGSSRAARSSLAAYLGRGGGFKGPVCRTASRTLVACGDHHMWVLNKDQGVGQGLLKHGNWQRNDFDTALRLISQRKGAIGPIFVDVGANIGTHSVYAALSGRFERVVAIEAEPRNAEILRDNIRLNDLQVDIVQKAVGPHTGIVHLALHEHDAGMHVTTDTPGENSIEVDADTLPNMLQGLNIDAQQIGLVWMDIEGREFDVLATMEELMRHRTPVFFEYGRWSIGDNESYWAERIRSFGYKAWIMHHGGHAEPADIADALKIEFGNILLI
jgi:FkbM family methyltransferase